MLIEPGAIGSIQRQSTDITGDCQSPSSARDGLVDLVGVDGHVAGVERRQRQREAGGEQRGNGNRRAAWRRLVGASRSIYRAAPPFSAARLVFCRPCASKLSGASQRSNAALRAGHSLSSIEK